MGKMVQRGYVPSDKREFSEDGMEKLLAAGSNLYYLLNRGYPIKSASVFVGNHYLLSERFQPHHNHGSGVLRLPAVKMHGWDHKGPGWT